MDGTSDVLNAFSAVQAARLTGLSPRQLAYWDRIGFFAPQYAAEDRRSPYSRIYSFKDVVGLRTLSLLKGRHGVSLRHLREVAARLSKYSATPWADLKLKVWDRKVHFSEPETGRMREVVDGQYFLLPMADVIEDVRRQAQEMTRRDQGEIGQIKKHRYVAHNAPVIAGTRVRVSTIRHFLEAGYSVAEILKEYPTLKEADVEAAARHGGAVRAA